MSNDRTVELTGDVTEVRENSIRFHAGDIETFIPKSQVVDITVCDTGEYIQDVHDLTGRTEGVTIEIPEWLAIDRGLV